MEFGDATFENRLELDEIVEVEVLMLLVPLKQKGPKQARLLFLTI